MAAISQWQKSKIYAIGGALGLVRRGDELDSLHALVEGITGKASVRALTYGEANAVITELVLRQGAAEIKTTKKSRAYADTPGGMTGGQQGKVWYLMTQLAGCDRVKSTAALGERLAGVICREFMFVVDKREPLRWFTAEQGWQLIEILKRYLSSAEKKAMRG